MLTTARVARPNAVIDSCLLLTGCNYEAALSDLMRDACSSAIFEKELKMRTANDLATFPSAAPDISAG
jgi:hypothetical protein